MDVLFNLIIILMVITSIWFLSLNILIMVKMLFMGDTFSIKNYVKYMKESFKEMFL